MCWMGPACGPQASHGPEDFWTCGTNRIADGSPAEVCSGSLRVLSRRPAMDSILDSTKPPTAGGHSANSYLWAIETNTGVLQKSVACQHLPDLPDSLSVPPRSLGDEDHLVLVLSLRGYRAALCVSWA